MRPAFSSTVVLLCAFLGANASRADATFRSGPTRVSVIELYTSEGCSSCPPAEKWLGELRSDPGLWRQFVPVAFHVNYWDRLGWRDAFATREFTQRQYAYADTWRSPSVYTPCFVRDGAEWHPRGANAVAVSNPGDAGTLELAWHSDGNCDVAFSSASNSRETENTLDVTIALLGGGILSPVRAGENAGRELRHDFVVLQLVSTPLARAGADAWTAHVVLREPAGAARPPVARRAIAAWITPHGALAPVQAVGGWLP